VIYDKHSEDSMTDETTGAVGPTEEVEYEGKVRSDDPMTSWDAAAQQTQSRTEVLQNNLEAILKTSGPMTDSELHAKYVKLRDLMPSKYRDVTEQSVRSRRSELRKAGRVENSDVKRASANGSPSIVWRYVAR